MSGRVRVELADGRTVTGFRKTLRRNPRKSPIERVHDFNAKCAKRFQSKWVRDVRVGFFLPRALQSFVASGPHAHNVNVWHGFVQIMHGSAEECFMSAEHFFFDVARDRPAFTVLAAVTSKDFPERRYCRHLTVVNGAMVVSSGWQEPKIFQA